MVPDLPFLCKLHEIWSADFSEKHSNYVATGCHILRLKCTKFDFGWISAPDPAGEAYSVPLSALTGFKMVYF